MTPIEIIALVFAIIVLVKIISLLVVHPKTFDHLLKELAPHRFWLSVLFLLVIGIVGYFLYQEAELFHIVSAMLLGIMLYGLGIIQYPHGYYRLGTEVMKDRKRLWLPVVLWVLLSLWVLYSLYLAI